MTKSNSSKVAIATLLFLTATIATAMGGNNASAASETPSHVESLKAHYDIPAQPLSTALKALAQTADIQLIFTPDAVTDIQTKPLKGDYTAQEALGQLLTGTQLTYTHDGKDTIVVKKVKTLNTGNTGEGQIRVAQNTGNTGESSDEQKNKNSTEGDDPAASSQGSEDSSIKGIPEILVKGSRLTDADIRRTEDDIQPYVVFEGDEIRESQATNVDEFLRTRLPANTSRTDINDARGITGAQEGRIDLRGLGTSQTLILVDGRRIPGIGSFDLRQASIAGLPMNAIERIEVLPSTAGAIHGGSAVGGVVNIILKRDYSGFEIETAYGNTFDFATGDTRYALNGGFALDRMQFMVTASHSETGELLLSERSDLVRRSRELGIANNPAAFLPGTPPPLGATTNICASAGGLTSPCNGASLVLDDGTPLGASFLFVPSGYPGPVAAGDGGHGLLANAGQYNLDAANNGQALIQSTVTDSIGLSARSSLTSNLEIFGDVYWDERSGEFESGASISTGLSATNPNNPFQQGIRITMPLPGVSTLGRRETSSLRFTGGAIWRLANSWSASIEHTWGQSISSAFSTQTPLLSAARTPAAPFGTRDSNLFPPDLSAFLAPSPSTDFGPIENTMVGTTFRASGPTVNLPGGALTLSGLVEQREESIDGFWQSSVLAASGTRLYFFAPPRHQEVRSAYVEATAPLIHADNHVPLVNELSLQASIRHDEYETVGTDANFLLTSPTDPIPVAVYRTNNVNSTDYLFGFRYSPIAGLVFRSSYSTGFLPPSLSQLVSSSSSQPAAGLGATDPLRGGTPLTGDAGGTIEYTGGGNSRLEPELSTSLSIGAIFEPAFLEGFRLSVDYTQIRKTDEIGSLTNQQIIDNESRLPGRVVRGPNLVGDPPGWAGPIIGLDASFANISTLELQAFDVQADYLMQLPSWGEVRVYALLTHQTDLTRTLAPGALPVQYVDYSDGPLEWRANAGVDWTLDDLRISWSAQYYDDYRVCGATNSTSTCASTVLSQGATSVDSQIYHDLAVRYEFDEASSILSGVVLSAGIQNVFDADPLPIGTATGPIYSPYGDPRLRRFSLALRKRF